MFSRVLNYMLRSSLCGGDSSSAFGGKAVGRPCCCCWSFIFSWCLMYGFHKNCKEEKRSRIIYHCMPMNQFGTYQVVQRE